MKKFWSATKGNVAIMTAMGIIGIVAAGGGAVDYTRILSAKADAQRAVDAATLRAARVALDGDNLSVQQDQGRELFRANCQDIICNDLTVADVTNMGTSIQVSASFSTQTYFLGVAGLPTIDFTVVAEALLSQPGETQGDVDLHIVLDASSSMSLPDGPAEIQRFNDLNFSPFNEAISCSWACHTNNNQISAEPLSGFELAKQATPPIKLREDRIREAAHAVVDNLESGPLGAHVRIGLHRFSNTLDSLLSTPTNSFNMVRTAIDSYIGLTQPTDFEVVLPNLAAAVGQNGDGTPANPYNVVLMVTDGVQTPRPGGYFSSGPASPLNPAWCDGVKANTQRFYILHVPFPKTEQVRPVNFPQVIDVNDQSDAIEAALQGCASENAYFVTEHGDTFTDIFQQVVRDIDARFDGVVATIPLENGTGTPILRR